MDGIFLLLVIVGGVFSLIQSVQKRRGARNEQAPAAARQGAQQNPSMRPADVDLP